MYTRTIWFILALAASVPLAAPVRAQYIPPHSNDPHPPANQPSYQLPNPLARPGVPQYPGAAHSNDPHFRKTESVPQFPLSPSVQTPDTRPVIRRYPSQSTPRSVTKQERVERAARLDSAKGRKISLDECYRKWDSALGVSRAGWEQSCRRLASDGRIRTN